MEVVRSTDPVAFRRQAADLLLGDLARNNLVLAILQVLLDAPEVYPVFHLWLAVDGGTAVGCALQTEPRPVILGEPLVPAAIDAVVDAMVDDDGPLPGLTANDPWGDRALARIAARTGRAGRRRLEQGVWQL